MEINLANNLDSLSQLVTSITTDLLILLSALLLGITKLKVFLKLIEAEFIFFFKNMNINKHKWLLGCSFRIILIIIGLILSDQRETVVY